MSGTQIRAFRPLGVNRTVNIAVTTASQTLPIPDTPFGTRSVRMVNFGSQVIFIDFLNSGTVGNASVTNSIPLLPNTVEVFTIGNDLGSIITIAAATGSTLYVTYGEGL